MLNQQGKIIGSSAPKRFRIDPVYRRPGWVEYDPAQMLETVCAGAQAAVRNAGVSFNDITGIGLANQGETVIAFDRKDGHPICPAISWQDRRAEPIVQQWRSDGLETDVRTVTGLRLDSYFSAAKFAWILRHVPLARELQASGRLCLATSDSWLLWQLTGGRYFVTDVATASRTMLLDLDSLQWSRPLADSLDIPSECLPEIVSNTASIGSTHEPIFGSEVLISGLCVDQQAALFGHRALEIGQAKITYGTGCFALANVGSNSACRAPGLLTCVGWRIGDKTSYVFDGGVYSAGSLVEWLVELGLAESTEDTGRLALMVDDSDGVMLIPAFSGLAAPHWSGRTRACWIGMNQGTNNRHLVRAAFEAIAFRVKEILDAMEASDVLVQGVNVDGGLAQSDVLMQLQADVLGLPVRRSATPEFTALGVGYFAGLGSGVWQAADQLPPQDPGGETFDPQTAEVAKNQEMFRRWRRACAAVVDMGEAGVFE